MAAALSNEQAISFGNKAFSKVGVYAEPEIADILTLEMLKGTQASFKKPDAIFINQSLATAMFGNADPINKVIKLNDQYNLLVTGVYKDMPKNTQFSHWNFIAPVGVLFSKPADANNWHSYPLP